MQTRDYLLTLSPLVRQIHALGVRPRKKRIHRRHDTTGIYSIFGVLVLVVSLAFHLRILVPVQVESCLSSVVTLPRNDNLLNLAAPPLSRIPAL